MNIDLHHMNRNEAIRFFIVRYNEIFQDGYRNEIEVIHGYGSTGKGGIIKAEFKRFSDSHKNSFKCEVRENKGVTYVTPKTKIQEIGNTLTIDLLKFCRETPKSIDKIKGNFFKTYSNKEINGVIKKLIKQGKIERIPKKKSDTYLTKEV